MQLQTIALSSVKVYKYTHSVGGGAVSPITLFHASCCNTITTRSIAEAAEVAEAAAEAAVTSPPRRLPASAGCSSASAFCDDHSVVLVLVGDDSLVVDIEDRDGFELRRNATRLRRFLRVVGVQHRLDDGVLRRSQTVVQRKVAAPRAFERLT